MIPKNIILLAICIENSFNYFFPSTTFKSWDSV